MANYSPPLDPLGVPSDDYHQSEYTASWDKRCSAVPRAGVFQPKVKARVRKGGGRGDGGTNAAAAPVAAKTSPVVPVTTSSDVVDVNKSNTEGVPQPSVKGADALISKEIDSAPGLSNGTTYSERDLSKISPVPEHTPQEIASPRRSLEPAPANGSTPATEADSVLAGSTVTPATQESQLNYTQESCVTTEDCSQPFAVRSTFPIPSSLPSAEEGVQEDAVAQSEEPSSDPRGDQQGEPTGVAEPARPNKLKNNARKTRRSSTTAAGSDIPSTSSREAVDDDLEETPNTLDDELFAHLEYTDTSGRKRKRAFPHSTSRPRGGREDRAESSKGSKTSRLNCDLSNPSVLPLREVIRRAENIERKKAKEEMARKSLSDVSKPKERDAVQEPEPPRDVLSLAPQVQVIDGRIVVNEQSLTVGAYATSAQDTEQYTRVEEKASRLNYQTYSNRTVTERWKPEETDMFYKALTQFGTDFDLIRNLFPTRTRRQIKAKYKKEETVNPRRVTDALTYRPKDQSHYEEMLVRMNRDDLIPDTSDPFASILAYSVGRAAEKADLRENAEVDNTQTEEEVLANIID